MPRMPNPAMARSVVMLQKQRVTPPLPVGMTGVPRDLPAIRRKARQLSSQPRNKKGEPALRSKAELRHQLRPIFDKLDVDRSGSVSADELGMLLKQIKLERTPAQLKALMAEADPDRSGDVDFSEFVNALHEQMRAGGGGGELTAVVAQTSSFFGFLNPFSWFSKPQPAAEVAELEPAEPEPTPHTQHAVTAPKVVVGTSYGELRPWRVAPVEYGFPRALSPESREECKTYGEQLNGRKCLVWTMDHELTDPFEC